MEWPNFDGPHAYTRDQFAARVADLSWSSWRPSGICLHNTSAPTLKQWAESGVLHDQRIANLKTFYQGKGWHAGPHLFISRNWINGFSDILAPGVHCSCMNSTHIGIEMVGDFNTEEFASGDGALVRDNSVFALAVLHKKLGLDPRKLALHVDCKRDAHDCPGRKVDRGDVIARVLAVMSALGPAGPVSASPPISPPAAAVDSPDVAAFKQIQRGLAALGTYTGDIDGKVGPLTRKAAKASLGI